MLDLKTIIFFGAYSIKNISEKSNVLAHPITMLVPTPKFQHEYQSQTSGSQQKGWHVWITRKFSRGSLKTINLCKFYFIF